MKTYKYFLNIITKEEIIEYYISQNHTEADCYEHFNELYQITPEIFNSLLLEYQIHKPTDLQVQPNNQNTIKKHWFTNGINSTFSTKCPEGYYPGRGPKKLNANEQANADNFNLIINTVTPEELKEYYWEHSVEETLQYYNIRNETLLTKILTYFDYDFSKHKPSKFKGKPSNRSHESYIEGGKKSASTQKQHWKEKSEDEKQAWIDKQKEAHSTEHFKEIISKINIDYYANLTAEEKEASRAKKQFANKAIWSRDRDKLLAKINNTKKINDSFNSSKLEDIYYNALLEKFNTDDIFRQYSIDLRYPFACDFYIKSLDLFIELNFMWTHNNHKFNSASLEDKLILEDWKEKSKESDFYINAIETWTIRDINKFKTAQENNLNYKVYYTLEDALVDIENLNK